MAGWAVRSEKDGGVAMRLAVILGLSFLLGSVSDYSASADDGSHPASAAGPGAQVGKVAPEKGTLTLFAGPFEQKAIEIRTRDLIVEAQTTNLLEPEAIDRIIVSTAREQSRIDLDALSRPVRMEISDDLVIGFQYLKGDKVKVTATRFDGFASETKSATFKLPAAPKRRGAGSLPGEAPQAQTSGVSITARLQACPAPFRHPMPEDVRFALKYISPGIGEQDLSKGFYKGSNETNISFDLLQLKSALRGRDKTKTSLEKAFNVVCGEVVSLGSKGACKKALGETCGNLVTSIGDVICGEFENLTDKVDKIRKSELNGIDGSFDAIPSFNYPDSSGKRVTVQLAPFRYKPSEGLKEITYDLVPNCFSRYQGGISLGGMAKSVHKASGSVVCTAKMSFAGRLQMTVPQSGMAKFQVDGVQKLMSADDSCAWSDETQEKFGGELPVSGDRIDVTSPGLSAKIALSARAATGGVSIKSIISDQGGFLQTGEMSGGVQAKAY